MAVTDEFEAERRKIIELWPELKPEIIRDLVNVWLCKEKIAELGSSVERIEPAVVKILEALTDLKISIAEYQHHTASLIGIFRTLESTESWRKCVIQEMDYQIAVVNRIHEAIETRKPLETAFQTLCSLIEDGRRLVMFGVYGIGNILGIRGEETKGRSKYGYNPQQGKMDSRTHVLPDNVDEQHNLPKMWEKQFLWFRDEEDDTRIFVVRQSIQGAKDSRFYTDDRLGNSYSVGISIANKGQYSDEEASVVRFVMSLFKENDKRFIELMDRLADRYVHAYDAEIKRLEENWRKAYGKH